jgi:DUF2934 family protein
MDQNEDPRELELKIEQAERIAARIGDPTTYERLKAWADELRGRLRRRLDAGRTKQAISTRAREIWEQNGRPSDRDLEFWLQAESEIIERKQQR